MKIFYKINAYKNYKFAVILIIAALLLPLATGALPLDGEDSESGTVKINQTSEEKTGIVWVMPYVTKTENNIEQTVPVESKEDMDLNKNTVHLRIQVYINSQDAEKYYGSKIYIFKLKPYEEITDIENAQPETNFDVLSSESFPYTVTLFSSELSNLNSGEIYNKFVVGVKEDEKFVPVSEARYIDNINCLSNKRETPPVSKTKKGLAIQMPGEARLLGVEHTIVNIFLNDLMSVSESANTEVYEYSGEKYYFNSDKFAEYDKKIKYLTNEGINVTAMLLISAEGFMPSSIGINGNSDDENAENANSEETPQSFSLAEPVEYMIHPDALASVQLGITEPYYYGLNLTNENGFKYFSALMSYIAEKYVRKDVGYGRIYNIILGNQIGRSEMFNNCGKTDIENYARNYLRALRICDTAIRSRFGGSRVYVPFDNWFTAKTKDGGDFVNKEVIDLLCEYSQQEGNFIWNVAWTAYNDDRLSPEFWKESAPVNDYSTQIITMKNIEVLCNYINIEKKDFLPEGESRKVMLTNQGFSSGDNSKESMELQAAAFIYAYLKARYIPDITAFIYHGHVDSKNDLITNLGLWTNAVDTVDEPGEPKRIYEVFKYMDTNREAEKIEFAKVLLGVTDFNEIVRLYSKDAVQAVILEEVTGETLKSNPNQTYIGVFNDARLSGFIGSSNIYKMSRVTYENDTSAFNNRNMLYAGFSRPVKGDFGGISKVYEAGELDLSGEKYVGVRLRIDTLIEMPEDKKIQLYFIIESENEPLSQTGTTGDAVSQSTGEVVKTFSVFEGLANISPNKDETVYFDISAWSGKSNIRKIKLLVNPYANYSQVSQSDSSAGTYDFNLYVYSIISARVSRMSWISTFLIILTAIIFAGAAVYGVLYIRAKRIRKRRLRERQEQRRRAREAAIAAGRQIPPNPANRNNNNKKR